MQKKIKLNLYKIVLGWLLQRESHIYKYARPILKAYSLSIVFALLPAFGRQKINNIWVIGSKIFNSDYLFKNCTLISTPRDLKKIDKFPKYFAQFYNVYSLIYFSYVIKNQLPLKIAEKIINRSLRKYAPPLIIINSTKDPFNKLVALVAKENNIKTICIQHGLFSYSIPDEVNEDDVVDEYIAINENQRKIVSKKIIMNKIKTLSTSELITNIIYKNKISKICLIGEDWERYGDRFKKQKIINFYLDFYKLLKDQDMNDLQIYYKPHPSEQDLFGIDKFIPQTDVDLDQIDLFIGFSSTLLWDMVINEKICVQIYSDEISDIDFNIEKICMTIPLDNLALQNLLLFIHNPIRKYKITKKDLSEVINLL
jgi:hypothetical protein